MVKMLVRQIAKFVCSQAGHESDFVYEPSMRSAGGEQSLDFLSSHRPPVGRRSCVERSQRLQRVICQIAALNAPIAERPERFRVVGQRLARATVGLKTTQSYLDTR